MKIVKTLIVFCCLMALLGIPSVYAESESLASHTKDTTSASMPIITTTSKSQSAKASTTEISSVIAALDATLETKASTSQIDLKPNPKRPCLDVKGRCQPKMAPKQDDPPVPINIEADSAEGHKDDILVYIGDVELIQGYQKIISNTLTYNKPENTVTAKGNAYFYDGEIEGISDTIKEDLTSKVVVMNGTQYQFLCSFGRGEAKVVLKDGLGYYQLKDGTYTTCPVGNNSWHLASKEIEHMPDSTYASLYNNTFRVMGVPIFYTPYMRMPVTQDRLTGFLYPTFGISTRDGTTFRLPFYWNIAPEYDLTLTPYVMSQRGIQLQSEFRYISPIGDGRILGEYLADDKLHPDEPARWAVNWQNYKRVGHWRYNIDYSQVSDINYFAQLESSIGNIEDSTLLQSGEASYYSDHWQVTLMARNFQSLFTNNQLYRVLPKLSVNYNKLELLPWMNLKWDNQFARFQNDSKLKPSATRIHSEPTISIPYSNSWLSLEAEGKVYYTHYEQDFEKSLYNNSGEGSLKHQVDRVIPSLKLNASVLLDRPGSLFGNSYLQVLEPKVQYLYVPKVDQSGIYNPADFFYGGYDSTRLQSDYHALFRNNNYSSIDYISNANQITIGATTRFYDSQMKERFNFSLGQIIYLGAEHAKARSVIATDSEFNYDDFLFARTALEYSSHEKKLQYANATLELRSRARFVQLSYRFVSDEYIINNLQNPSVSKYTDDGISQVGISGGLPINHRFSVRSQLYYDTRQRQLSEGSVNLSFSMDCWSIGINMGRNMYYRSNIHTEPRYENNVSVSIALLGLGSNVAVGYDLKQGLSNILGYGDPFNLRY